MSIMSTAVPSPVGKSSGSPYPYPELDSSFLPSSADGSSVSAGLVEDPRASFEKVATVVAIYKVALFWAGRVKAEPGLYSAEEQDQKLSALLVAEKMLLDVTRNAERLPGASQQQLHILQNELLNQGVSTQLELHFSSHRAPVPQIDDTLDSASEYGSDDPFLASPQHYAQETTYG